MEKLQSLKPKMLQALQRKFDEVQSLEIKHITLGDKLITKKDYCDIVLLAELGTVLLEDEYRIEMGNNSFRVVIKNDLRTCKVFIKNKSYDDWDESSPIKFEEADIRMDCANEQWQKMRF